MSSSSPGPYDHKGGKKYSYSPPRIVILLLIMVLAFCLGTWAALSFPHSQSSIEESAAKSSMEPQVTPPVVKVNTPPTALTIPKPKGDIAMNSLVSSAEVDSKPAPKRGEVIKRKAVATLLTSTISPSGSRTDTATVDSFMLMADTLLDRAVGLNDIDVLVLVTNDFDSIEMNRVETFVERHPKLKIKRVAPVSLPPDASRSLTPAQKSVLANQLTKLQMWSLFEYSKVLYVDVNCAFVQDPLGAFGLCERSSLCASPLSTGGKGKVSSSEFSTSLMVISPSTEQHNALLDAVDAFQGDVKADTSLLSLFPSKWTSLGSAPYLLYLKSGGGVNAGSSVPSSPYDLPYNTNGVCGELASVFEKYQHFNLPWNLRKHALLISELPSLAHILSKRRQKLSRQKSRNNRLRKQARSSRLDH